MYHLSRLFEVSPQHVFQNTQFTVPVVFLESTHGFHVTIKQNCYIFLILLCLILPSHMLQTRASCLLNKHEAGYRKLFPAAGITCCQYDHMSFHYNEYYVTTITIYKWDTATEAGVRYLAPNASGMPLVLGHKIRLRLRDYLYLWPNPTVQWNGAGVSKLPLPLP
jgi:hypothetical protein